MARFFLSALMVSMLSVSLLGQDSRVFELRTYSSEPGRQSDTLKLMSNEGLGYMKKHKLDVAGIFTPVDISDERVFMLVSHADKPSLDAAAAAMTNDDGWKEAVKKSEVDGKKPVKGIEKVILSVNDYSPKLEVKEVGNRIFELRTYVTTKGNLSALNSRFRNHTLGLFAKHGMTNILYCSVRSGETTNCGQLLKALSPIGKDAAEVDLSLPATGNALVYFLAHASTEAAASSFGKFREDQDWIKARQASETAAGGSLTVGGGVKSLFLKPVGFSPLK